MYLQSPFYCEESKGLISIEIGEEIIAIKGGSKAEISIKEMS